MLRQTLLKLCPPLSHLILISLAGPDDPSSRRDIIASQNVQRLIVSVCHA